MRKIFDFYILLVLALFCAMQAPGLAAQDTALDRVMTSPAPELAVDKGGAGLLQRLLKLRTTASVLHTTAHPDDEHAGTLTYLSRGLGARTALLTLNRGEAGANAIGAELFDGLGLIRTEELLLAGRYYGLDDQYFTVVIDYGYSKTLDEALRSWNRQELLGEMVRVIRLNRPLVVVSRFHGSARDGHGNHQAVGGLTPEAAHAAGDPAMFPEQITDEGLRPWIPLKVYRGGVRSGEPWHVRVDVGQHSPWLGASYQNFGRYGLSLQRSQTSGRARTELGPVLYHYESLHGAEEEEESGFFDGLDTSISGLFMLTGETPSAEANALLEAIEAHVESALEQVDMRDPSAILPDLVEGLRKTRALLDMAPSEASFLLRIKERQFTDAINTALGMQFTAVAALGDASGGGSPFAAAPTMGMATPGQKLRVEVRLLNPSATPVTDLSVTLAPAVGDLDAWDAQGEDNHAMPLYQTDFTVRVPEDAAFSRPYYFRASMRENQYQIRDVAYKHLPARTPALSAVANYTVLGEQVEMRQVVQTREADLPYGYVLRELKVAPALAVSVAPEQRVVVPDPDGNMFQVLVDVLNNHAGEIGGELRLETPEGWSVAPERHEIAFSQAGQRREYSFDVFVPRLDKQDYTLHAVATALGNEYREGYDVIRHRDLGTRYLYHPSRVRVSSLDVQIALDLSVAYVMGVGDDVPSGIEQLGASVRLLTASDLASGDLSEYDAIVVGTRAYAVRQDLHTYNTRLLDYASEGGNLIVLYQTQEFVPDDMAPFGAQLPRGAEEVSEEDAPVTILEPDHRLFAAPNRITLDDFGDWIEQRGSKFFTTWDEAYTPLIETHDTGQEPQSGVWLTARVGEGHYTYCALAFHRQLPYAVPGPFRLFANLLSLGQEFE